MAWLEGGLVGHRWLVVLLLPVLLGPFQVLLRCCLSRRLHGIFSTDTDFIATAADSTKVAIAVERLPYGGVG
jgi:hypothetical protein